MKIWHQYGSEHSDNLVMIGRFKSADEASEVCQLLRDIGRLAQADEGLNSGIPPERFGHEMRQLLEGAGVHSLRPAELVQFAQIFEVETVVGEDDDPQVVMTTDEFEVSALLKILFHRGARVEVYSAHHHPDTGYGRGS